MPLLLQNSTKIGLDEKMRGYWLIRTSVVGARDRRFSNSHRRRHWTACCEEVDPAGTRVRDGERKFAMSVVTRKTETVTRQACAGDNFHTLSDGEESESETDLASLDEQDVWYATDDKAEYEAMIGLREARKKLQRATNSRCFYDNGRERVTPNRSKSIRELKNVTTCNRCGALGHREDEGPHSGHRQRSSPSDPAEAEDSENNRPQERCDRKAKARAKGKGWRVKFEETDPTQEVYRCDREERKCHMNVPPGWAVLDCCTPKSLAEAELAAMLVKACEKRGRKAGDDGKVEAVKEKNHFRGIREQVITSPRITEGSTSPLAGNEFLLPWGSSIQMFPVDWWLWIPSR